MISHIKRVSIGEPGVEEPSIGEPGVEEPSIREPGVEEPQEGGVSLFSNIDQLPYL
ncbi:hypothetical protein A2U01_0060201, partial [Trifolium medium]|nr:hypothetical protein [Trifolium medium]